MSCQYRVIFSYEATHFGSHDIDLVFYRFGNLKQRLFRMTQHILDQNLCSFADTATIFFLLETPINQSKFIELFLSWF